ncbi:MAG TPA: hypothetical protein VJT50_09595 [Pyrinomonadaceae bacterium]|nr:hypothetical protein [Pyrinomonadaceae bacterium]
MTRRSLNFITPLCLVIALAGSLHAKQPQGRDHLTAKEVDLVKDAQELDKRIDVFIKAIDRRLMIISGQKPVPTKKDKADAELWGESPEGTRSDLVGDIAGIFDEAITNVDDVSLRDENNPALPKALRKLAAEATRVLDQLKPLESSAKSPTETSNFSQLIDNAETIVQAASKLPPEVVQQRKAKGEKTKN